MGVIGDYADGLHGIGSSAGKRKSRHHMHDYSATQHIADNLGGAY